MLNNKNAGFVLEHMKKLAAAGIEMNLQIVLCKGINDGAVLDKSIEELAGFYPQAKSLSVVPIGLTRFREGLYPMEPFGAEDSADVIEAIEGWQKVFKQKKGSNFVFAADEFYINANAKFPSYESYEDFPQIENGVGMISSMKREFDDCYASLEGGNLKRKLSLATGTAAFEFIKGLALKIEKKFPMVEINVFPVENEFFGGKISVSGLLCGRDIINSLKGHDLGEFLCLPQNLLRNGEDVLLDNITVGDIERELNIKVRITGNSGEDFIKTILN